MIFAMALFVITMFVFPILRDGFKSKDFTPCGVPYKKGETQVFQQYVEPFSPSQYMDRIEKENIKILQDREKQEPYTIILWLNLQGLRLNDDGSFEWIERVKKEENEILALMQDENQYKRLSSDYSQSQAQNLQYQNVAVNYGSTSSQLNQLMAQCTQSQIDSLQLAQLQRSYNIALANAINPYSYIPAYPFYGGSCYGQATQNF